MSEVNEECFSNGYLDFSGEIQWYNTFRGVSNDFEPSNWRQQEALRFRTPAGSQWTVIKPGMRTNGDRWVFKDYVAVPESLEAGQYVLSMRWDCQATPQIWSACANIEIV